MAYAKGEREVNESYETFKSILDLKVCDASKVVAEIR